ncbi:MAG: hypothetical protein LBD06_09100 [Candidatus Accumulibacter sp.]|nr:hypothetical protein [Accumulibacter sp.]
MSNVLPFFPFSELRFFLSSDARRGVKLSYIHRARQSVPEDRGQKTEDRRQKNRAPGFSSLIRREAPKRICLLSSPASVL